MHKTDLHKGVEVSPIVPFDKFDKLSKLVNVTVLSKFKCLNQRRMLNLWNTTGLHQCAKTHLIQVMQRQAFPGEIGFLCDVRNKQVPELVNKWKLFIGEDDLVRSDGRIEKKIL